MSDQNRLAFEAWATTQNLPTEREGDRYAWADVNDYWIGWQARSAKNPTPEGCALDCEAETFAMSKFASRADRDAALLREIASLRQANGELAAAAIVPEGYALVPLEPTEAMHVAAVRTIVRCTGNDDFPPRVWRAMVGAAPKAAATEPEARVSYSIHWPTMPPSRGQSPVLFEDGYAEGYARCLSDCKAAAATSHPTPKE